jgi:hypothetical protein
LTFVQVELSCPEHGLERFKIKIVKKYNVNKESIAPKFRTKPRHELSGLIVGRDVSSLEIRDYVVQYFREAGMMDRVLSMRLQV